jgi:hypothetical protein
MIATIRSFMRFDGNPSNALVRGCAAIIERNIIRKDRTRNGYPKPPNSKPKTRKTVRPLMIPRIVEFNSLLSRLPPNLFKILGELLSFPFILDNTTTWTTHRTRTAIA